jgi:hypothetical protein
MSAWDWDDAEGNVWEPDEEYFEEQSRRDADRQQEEDVRNGGLTIMDVVHVIEKHYGLDCGCVQTRNRAVVHLWSPPHQTVATFHLSYDGQLWHIERADCYAQDVESDWESVKRAVEESQGLPDGETSEGGTDSIVPKSTGKKMFENNI